MPSSKVKRAIRAFEKAVENRVFKNTIPLHCDRLIIEHNYVKARAKLEGLMENL